MGETHQLEAALLLLDLLALGGRLKRRCLRGLMPQLGGFFQSSQPAVRTLGELVAKNAVDDPQLVDQAQVTQCLHAAKRMLPAGVKVEIKGQEMIFVEKDWKESRYCGILLEVVSKTLEQKLLKDRELERGAYEAAFNAGPAGGEREIFGRRKRRQLGPFDPVTPGQQIRTQSLRLPVPSPMTTKSLEGSGLRAHSFSPTGPQTTIGP